MPEETRGPQDSGPPSGRNRGAQNPPEPPTASTSARMSRQKSQDTGPELALRRLLHRRGLRYRVAYRVPELPRRTIDIAFTRARIAVFVDGCFWHGCPEHGSSPHHNAAWWRDKIARNRERDAQTTRHLEGLGWTVVRVWEHESPDDVAPRVERAVREALDP